MRITSRTLALIAAVVVLALAAQTYAQPPGPQRGPGNFGQGGLIVPGYGELRSEAVQEEIDLIPAQKEKLQKIGEDYMAAMREGFSSTDFSRIREMEASEREAFMTELREKREKLSAQAKEQVEQVLLPHQIDALKKIALRSRLRMISSDRVLENLDLTSKQKEQLKAAGEKLAQKTREIQDEILDEVLEILTEEQVEKLQSGQGMGFFGGNRGGGAAGRGPGGRGPGGRGPGGRGGGGQ